PGENNCGLTMAHELGHACGLSHAPCGTPGDPNYPAYEPYDPVGTHKASIVEYVLNITNGNILTPNQFKDWMSYCGPRWISLYHFGRLVNNQALDPQTVCNDYVWWRDYIIRDPFLIPEKWLPDPPPDPLITRVKPHMEPVISVLGVLYDAKRVEITSVIRVDAETAIRGGKRTNLTVQLVERDGRVLAQGTVHVLRSNACSACGSPDEQGDRYPMTFQAFVADLEGGAALRLADGETTLWERHASKTRPRITSFSAKVRKPKVS